MKFRLSSWITALALAVAGISFTAGPATAASGYCPGSGVNVVVDFGALGGGVQKGCGQGSLAAADFTTAGFAIRYNAQMGGGFVCTVSAEPLNRECGGPPNQGYWALFTATPGGSWSYASLGADSQAMSNGQTVAFAWQSPQDASGGGHRNPNAIPAPAIKKPTPSSVAATTHGATASGTKTHASSGASATPSATTSTAPRKHKHKRANPPSTPTAAVSASATPLVSMSPASATTHPAQSSSGLPWWIPVGVVVVLVIGAAYAWWRKRVST